ncbi:mechanosensitive ion channel family protein [Candidatus Gracilibacteria bacterium]|nr:mechanosensitive ion channel family protein [Candidatus Gracilibacteria bacterium]
MIEAYELGNRNLYWDALFGPGLLIVLSAFVIDYGLLALVRRWLERVDLPFTRYLFTALKGKLLLVGIVVGAWVALITIISSMPQLRWWIDRAAILLLLTIAVGAMLQLLSGWVTIYFGEQQNASVSLLKNIVRGFSALIVAAVVFSVLGVDISTLLTLIAGSSVGIAFALEKPLGNLFGGVQILASGRFKVGNYVRLSSGEEGYITDIRWSDTYIRQITNNEIIVPNAVMTSAIVVNFDRPAPELAVMLDVRVAFDSDLRRVEQVTTNVARAVMQNVIGGVPEVDPFIRYNQFAESGINFTVIMRGQTFIDQFAIRHEFVCRLQQAFAAEGIRIAYPVRALRNDHERPLHIQATTIATPDTQAEAKL